eukprot:CAMPEP_0204269964 /NCGR_PEP_ID=MMETSP0468-20130131/17765_1 /ASSEMBLY_ACC=CAM_ASM_000383 /TAXON_ID=2969 /ORGANISM="Oxyrrhis marina" /LENGTH=377 /DNA_ID=CAMNT_0051245437 /DNA_START=42 /DNA_END=1175 /DNA_ORIENTATION=+
MFDLMTGCGAAEQWPHKGQQRIYSYDWIRFDNSERARERRREIGGMTWEVVEAGGYILNGTDVEVQYPTAARYYGVGELLAADELRRFESTAWFVCDTTVPGTALQHPSVNHDSENPVALLCAGSAYDPGGGFLTGGRHALEEALMVQTTAWNAVDYIKESPWISDGSCVIVKDVVLFRHGSDKGYKFVEKPVPIILAISAAYNRNPNVNKTPIDAPEDDDEYRDGMVQRLRLAFHAAAAEGAKQLVVTDIGCGVFKNDPQVVGDLMGELLQEVTQLGWFSAIFITGSSSFKSAVMCHCPSASAQPDPAAITPPVWTHLMDTACQTGSKEFSQESDGKPLELDEETGRKPGIVWLVKAVVVGLVALHAVRLAARLRR